MLSQKHHQLLAAMFYSDEFNNSITDLSRRRFVTGLAAGGAVMGLGLGFNSQPAFALQSNSGPAMLRGNKFNLNYSTTPVI